MDSKVSSRFYGGILLTYYGYYSTITFDGKTFPIETFFTVSTMKQINFSFGETLEFSTTVDGGKVTSQELVTSGPDALVSFKLDASGHLTPDNLETLARDIRAALTNGAVSKASDESADKYAAQAKEFISSHQVLKSADPGLAYMLAEYIASTKCETLYDDAVIKVEPIHSSATEVSIDAFSLKLEDYGNEDDEDDCTDCYECGCDDCQFYNEDDDEEWDDDDDEDEDNEW